MSLLLLAACGPGGIGGVANYTLHLVPVVPSNETPFEGAEKVELEVVSSGAAPVTVDLGSLAAGDKGLATDLPELVDATITVSAWRGDEQVAWGRATGINLVTGELDLAVFVARPGQVGWFPSYPERSFSPAVAALGDGRFISMGGAATGGTGRLNREVAGIYTLDLTPPESALAFTEAGTVPEWTDANGATHDAGRSGFRLLPIQVAGNDEGKWVLAGGSAGSGLEDGTSVTASASLYDPDTGAFELLRDRDSLVYASSGYVALPNVQGAIVYWGGWGDSPSSNQVANVTNVQLYDPTSRNFRDLGVVTSVGQIDAGIADLGNDGTLLCGGGRLGDWDSDGYIDWVSQTACIQISLDGGIGNAQPLPDSRVGHAMVTLPDGRVLLAGGASSALTPRVPADPADEIPAIKDVWLYNPETDTWAEDGKMQLPRAGHTMTVLPDGRVLVAGGASTYLLGGLASEPLSCVEIFDPALASSEMVGDCSPDDAAGGLGGRAYQPSVAVDPDYGILFVGGGESDTTVQDVVGLFLP